MAVNRAIPTQALVGACVVHVLSQFLVHLLLRLHHPREQLLLFGFAAVACFGTQPCSPLVENLHSIKETDKEKNIILLAYILNTIVADKGLIMKSLETLR